MDNVKLKTETTRLHGAVDRFIKFAADRDIKLMLLEAVTVQDALERVAKVVTGTVT